MPDEVAQLDYARPVSRGRRLWWAGLAVVVVAAVAWAGWRVGPGVYRRAAYAYYYRRVAAYVAPADRVVYEEDPARAAVLVARDPAYRWQRYRSEAWRPYVNYWVEDVSQLARLGPAVSGIVVFSHVRRNLLGQERLVVVWTAGNGMRPAAEKASLDNQARVDLIYAVIGGREVMGRLGSMATASVAPLWVVEGERQYSAHLRMFAGQPDPADASRFTVRYELGEFAGVLEGQLLDDDRVELKARGIGETWRLDEDRPAEK